jgi:hypothetical protein
VAAPRKPPPHPLPPRWPDGKHKSWSTLDLPDRQAILQMIKHGQSTDAIVRAYKHVTVGTIAAVRAALNRR